MKVEDLRYIVFMINPEIKPTYYQGRLVENNEGAIFAKREDALEYAEDAIKDNLCTRFIVGSFVFQPQAERMYIEYVGSFGFKFDTKNINQLDLFK